MLEETQAGIIFNCKILVKDRLVFKIFLTMKFKGLLVFMSLQNV